MLLLGTGCACQEAVGNTLEQGEPDERDAVIQMLQERLKDALQNQVSIYAPPFPAPTPPPPHNISSQIHPPNYSNPADTPTSILPAPSPMTLLTGKEQFKCRALQYCLGGVTAVELCKTSVCSVLTSELMDNLRTHSHMLSCHVMPWNGW